MKERSGLRIDVGVGCIGIHGDGMYPGLMSFAASQTESRQPSRSIVECVGAGSNPILAQLEAMNPVHAAIIGERASGAHKRQPRFVCEYWNTGRSNAVFVKNAAGDRSLVVDVQRGE